MWLYKVKLNEIEKDFEEGRQRIRELMGRFRKSGGDEQERKVDLEKIKLELKVTMDFVRHAKERANFYLKMGENFDLVKFIDHLVGEVEKHDPELKDRIVKTIDERWTGILNQGGKQITG